MILLDTSVLSRTLRRRQPGPEEVRLRGKVEELLVSDLPVGIPALVLQELLSGVKTERQFAELQRHLFSAFTIVHPDTTDYIEAARLRNKCMAKGLMVSGPDCLIAAIAIAGGHRLIAIDEDFVAIAGQSTLQVVNPIAAH